MTISKDLLSQYRFLKIEIDDIHKAIKADEDKIAKLIEEGTVVDKVKGGEGGIQGFKIEGFPQMEYDKRRNLLRNKVNKARRRETELIEITTQIENQIEAVRNAKDRVILRKYYLEGLTQQEIANELYFERSNIAKILSKYNV